MLAKNRLRYVGPLGLAALLAGCDGREPVVEVVFAQPFPAEATDLRAFPMRLRGQYVQANKPGMTLQVEGNVLVQQWQDSLRVSPKPDSVGALAYVAQRYRGQAFSADSTWLRWQDRDTLADLRQGTRLRHYRGWYYLSMPNSDAAGTWTVQRLAVVRGQLQTQYFNPDSLRIRALAAGTVQLQREDKDLTFTLNPQSGVATRQVNDYAGLWLTDKEYLLKVLKSLGLSQAHHSAE